MLKLITPIIHTFDEADNIERTLAGVSWADQVLVIDSYSTDNTLAICARFHNVKVIQNAYNGPTAQSNFGLAQDIKTDWVLSMDADYVVTPALKQELSTMQPAADVKGFNISFEYLINGTPLKGSLYPPRTALYRRADTHYERDGHTQRAVVDGLVSDLKQKIQHDDRKPYSRWLASQKRYATQEAHKLSNAEWQDLSWPDRMRFLGVAPLLVIPYTLIFKGLIYSGKSGLIYTWQRIVAEVYLQVARLKLATK